MTTPRDLKKEFNEEEKKSERKRNRVDVTQAKGKRWICTIFPDCVDHEEVIVKLAAVCSYCAFGLEEAPTTGKEHVHGACCFINETTFGQLKKKFHATIHWEPMRGTVSQAVDYFSAAIENWEYGSKPNDYEGPGVREKNRWAVARDSAIAGDYLSVHPQILVSQIGNLMKLNSHFAPQPPSLDDYVGEWWYGVPGAGKTYLAYEMFPTAYRKVMNKWWDGYIGQDTVILDDLSQANLEAPQIQYFKIWPDRHAFRAETKGSSMMIRPKKFIVTSNHSISECFPNVGGIDLEAIKLRFKVRYFGFKYGSGGSGTLPLEGEKQDDSAPQTPRQDSVRVVLPSQTVEEDDKTVIVVEE